SWQHYHFIRHILLPSFWAFRQTGL
ncbi:transposase, partial [Shigella flexneri]